MLDLSINKYNVKAMREKDIKSMFSEMSLNEYTFYSKCKTNGFIVRTSTDLLICKDPECKSCTKLKEKINENKRLL